MSHRADLPNADISIFTKLLNLLEPFAYALPSGEHESTRKTQDALTPVSQKYLSHTIVFYLNLVTIVVMDTPLQYYHAIATTVVQPVFENETGVFSPWALLHDSSSAGSPPLRTTFTCRLPLLISFRRPFSMNGNHRAPSSLQTLRTRPHTPPNEYKTLLRPPPPRIPPTIRTTTLDTRHSWPLYPLLICGLREKSQKDPPIFQCFLDPSFLIYQQ
jgi:hypothetical protein